MTQEFSPEGGPACDDHSTNVAQEASFVCVVCQTMLVPMTGLFERLSAYVTDVGTFVAMGELVTP